MPLHITSGWKKTTIVLPLCGNTNLSPGDDGIVPAGRRPGALNSIARNTFDHPAGNRSISGTPAPVCSLSLVVSGLSLSLSLSLSLYLSLYLPLSLAIATWDFHIYKHTELSLKAHNLFEPKIRLAGERALVPSISGSKQFVIGTSISFSVGPTVSFV